ncbi:MAG: hydrogenase maturation nickel metallochaperone HypA [Ignavibacteriae bacterium]|nr:MAG: hydrogenase maturation nickel metallochaperone HypA [Ignavibacteriota bacterium]
MHELSIAQNILEIVHQYVPAEELENVEFVKVKVGEVAGVVTDSLTFGFEAITAGTSLNNAKLAVENIPFKVQCNLCSKIFSNEFGITICPLCNSSNTKILSGMELQVTEVLLKENEEEQ